MDKTWNSPAPSRTRGTAGFTLVELMVAACLMGLVAVALAGVLRQALQVWKRASLELEVNDRAAAILNQVGRDFRNSIELPGAPLLSKEGALSWAVARDLSPQTALAQPQRRLLRVTYEPTWEKGWQRREEVLTPSGPFQSTLSPLLRAPEEARWEYAYRSDEGGHLVRWEKSWPDPDRLPAGLRLTLILYDRNAQPVPYSRTYFSAVRGLRPWAR